MNDPLKAKLTELLYELAPEFEGEPLDPDADLREQLDIDSMDIHQLATRVYEELGVDVPETDWSELTTLNRAVKYIGAKAAQAG